MKQLQQAETVSRNRFLHNKKVKKLTNPRKSNHNRFKLLQHTKDRLAINRTILPRKSRQLFQILLAVMKMKELQHLDSRIKDPSPMLI
jgi:hypothetical protein